MSWVVLSVGVGMEVCAWMFRRNNNTLVKEFYLCEAPRETMVASTWCIARDVVECCT